MFGFNITNLSDPLIYIEYQMPNGMWSRFGGVFNSGPTILEGMKRAQRTFNANRVRAVDASGKVVDIL